MMGFRLDCRVKALYSWALSGTPRSRVTVIREKSLIKRLGLLRRCCQRGGASAGRVVTSETLDGCLPFLVVAMRGLNLCDGQTVR